MIFTLVIYPPGQPWVTGTPGTHESRIGKHPERAAEGAAPNLPMNAVCLRFGFHAHTYTVGLRIIHTFNSP